ncbi:hypothetical protein ACFYO1_38550 [Nocardia sp. NPDC006044]|uniref:helix-turn-helix transcriptional regulator n=1 Tax=Nocardia sp. NPDC006044 TaxID=3364306 RepID=UPI0036CB460D
MNTAQLSRGIETMAKPNAFAHPSLRDYLDPANGPCGNLLPAAFDLEFADYDELTARKDVDGAPIVLPVNTEQQAERLRAVRATHAMGLIVAVTNDVTGHSTYFAIRSGANFVVNIAISIERQTELLRTQLLDHLHSSLDTRRPPRDMMANRRAQDPQRPRNLAPTRDIRRPATPVLDDFDTRLLRMLRTSMTVAEIARHNYLSERSMYRRIRNLYDTMGVHSRAELVRAAPEEDAPAALALYRSLPAS